MQLMSSEVMKIERSFGFEVEALRFHRTLKKLYIIFGSQQTKDGHFTLVKIKNKGCQGVGNDQHQRHGCSRANADCLNFATQGNSAFGCGLAHILVYKNKRYTLLGPLFLTTMSNVLDMSSDVRDGVPPSVVTHTSLHRDHLHGAHVSADERRRRQLGGTHRNTRNPHYMSQGMVFSAIGWKDQPLFLKLCI
ncbi:hypothetical protein Tco_0579583 [Tanacetum coccineum]